MTEPTRRYREVARLFREHARSEGAEVVPLSATADDVAAAERALGRPLPASYPWFQLEFGDLEHAPIDIYSVRTPEQHIVGINLEARRDDHPALPPRLIAFSNSGSDYLCFDTATFTAGECPVVWWDQADDESQRPEPAAASFLDWLEAEIHEREDVRKGSLLDSLSPTYLDWIRQMLAKGRAG